MARASQTRGASRAVLLGMILYADPDTHLLWPGHDTLVHVSGASYRAVQRALPELAELGELEVLHDGRGRGGTGRYRLLVPDPAGMRPIAARGGDRPLVNPVGKHATVAGKHAENTPQGRAPRVKKGEEVLEDPPAPAASGGGAPRLRRGLRANGTNPRAVAAREAADARHASGVPALAASSIVPPSAADDAAWAAIRDRLRGQVEASTWTIWFAPQMLLGVDRHGVLVVCAPAEIISWLNDRFARLLEEAAAAAGIRARYCTPLEAAGLDPAVSEAI